MMTLVRSTLLWMAIATTTVSCQVVTQCHKSADVAFVMDASTSIGIDDFNKEKQFVKQVAGSFKIGPSDSQVGLITYSSNATLHIKFDAHANIGDFEKAVDGLPYSGGQTRIDKALKLAADDMFTSSGGARPRLPKVMIILTDGEQTRDPDAVALNEAVVPLRNLGVKIFAVGVGARANHTELRLLVVREDDIFTVQDFNELLQKAQDIAERTCEETQPGKGQITQCRERAYVGFVLDASRSINDENYQKEKDFVKDVASIFKLGPGESEIGLITFSNAAILRIKFGEHSDYNSFASSVDNLPQSKGLTRIDKALELAADGLFGSLGRASRSIPKVMIILTDGRQTDAPDARPLEEAVAPLRQLGVRVFAVGITNSVDAQELDFLVENDQDVFFVDDFDQLVREARTIAEVTCKASAKVPPCSRNVDFGFVMDASSSMGAVNFQKQKYFVDAIASSLIVESPESQLGVISYSNNATLYAHFGHRFTADTFHQTINSVPYARGYTRIDKALKLAATDLFSAAAGARPEVAKVLVVFTDGKQTDDPGAVPLREAVKPLRTLGVRVFAVGIGAEIDRSELREMVERSEDAFYVEDFDDLLLRTREIGTTTCAEAKPVLVNGGWTNWGSWTSCTLSCDGGVRYRFRACTNPPPANGGRDCPGAKQTRRACGTFPCSEQKCNDQVDLAIVIDASGSIGSRNFQREKEFVKTLASSFRISPSDTHAGIISYSDYAVVHAKLGDKRRIKDFKEAVDALPYMRGRTRIDLALKAAATELFTESNGARRGFAKILIILTDGKQTKVQDAIPLNEAVKPLSQAGVRVYAIGVGVNVDTEELRSMVDSDQDVLKLDDFQELVLKAKEIAGATCRPVPPTPAPEEYECHTSADVGFVMDSSGSIGSYDFHREQEFVNAMISTFTVNPSNTRVGVITYSDTASLNIKFDQYTNGDDCRKAIRQLHYAGGRTRIDLALRMAANQLFSRAISSRPGVPKVLVVLTDGQQTPAYDAIPLDEAVAPLHRAGVQVYAVGVGIYADPQELRLLVEKEKDLIVTKDFDELLRKVDELSKVTMCRIKTSEVKPTIEEP